MSSTPSTTINSDDDCVEVGTPQIETDMSSHGTTRAETRFCLGDGNGNHVTTSDDDSYGNNYITNSVVKRPRVMKGNVSNSEDSSHDVGSFAGTHGSAGTSGYDGGSRGRSACNPSTSGHDEDYSSYLRLMDNLSDDCSDDEDLNMAIIASLESQA